MRFPHPSGTKEEMAPPPPLVLSGHVVSVAHWPLNCLQGCSLFLTDNTCLQLNNSMVLSYKIQEALHSSFIPSHVLPLQFNLSIILLGWLIKPGVHTISLYQSDAPFQTYFPVFRYGEAENFPNCKSLVLFCFIILYSNHFVLLEFYCKQLGRAKLHL